MGSIAPYSNPTSTAPSTLTDTFVTRPANSTVTPKAKIKGHAVGAGTSIVLGVRGLSFNCSVANSVAISTSAAENVNHSENHNPHSVHKMPVHGEYLHATGMLHT